jgi:hypothetical protein
MTVLFFGFVTFSIGLVISGLAIPLVWRMVPMNAFYGVRFSQSFKSNENWYEINHHGGKALLWASVPLYIMGLIGLFVPSDFEVVYVPTGIGVIVVSILAACLVSYRKARQIDRNRELKY